MRLYRIATPAYVANLSGEGARLYGGRWTPAGYPAVYAAEHPALAGWEKWVHAGLAWEDAPLGYELAGIDVPDSVEITRIAHMPNDPAEVGRAWIDGGETLLLQVPSVVVPCSWNYILNPQHPAMGHVSLVRLGIFVFDSRAYSS